jgi:hypothetical protein
MPVVAAVLPHPPLLVAELAGAAAAELDPLRAACHKALSAVLGAADVTVVVGDGPVWGVPEPAATGSFQPYGADIEVTLPALVALDLPGLPPPARLEELPLSLAVAAHLLAALDPPPTRLAAVTVPGSLGPGAAAAIGRTLTAAAHELGPTGLVAMADLSACRSDRAPGAFREEAAGFDATIAEAFRSGDPARLLHLDPAQAADLLVAGRVPLQTLAGAFAGGSGDERAYGGRGGVDGGGPVAGGSGSRGEGVGGRGGAGGEMSVAGGSGTGGEGSLGSRGRVGGELSMAGESGTGGEQSLAGDPPLRGQVLYDDAPYGVGYLVALLTGPRPSTTLPPPPRDLRSRSSSTRSPAPRNLRSRPPTQPPPPRDLQP